MYIKQSGIALVSVMAAIAVITAIITALTYRQQLDIGVQSYGLHKNQAILNVLSVESIAMGMLTGKAEGDSNVYDYYDESWAKPIIGLNIGGTNTTFMIFDAQAKFNLNNLNTRGANRNNARNLVRLIFQKDGQKYGRTYDEINRWISPSKGSISTDKQYTLETDRFDKYRVAHAPMVSINELRLMRGLREKEDLQEIIVEMNDYFSFLPTINNYVKININTAGEELLTQTLKYFNSQTSVTSLLSRRPFTSINSFCSSVKSKRPQCSKVFDTKSSYFYAIAKIGIGDNVFYSRSLIKLKNNKAKIISRGLRAL